MQLARRQDALVARAFAHFLRASGYGPKAAEKRDMVSLSDDEMRAVMELAAPVCPDDRGRFLRSVADELSGYPPERRGPGLVRQIALRHQQRLLSEPALPPPWMVPGWRWGRAR